MAKPRQGEKKPSVKVQDLEPAKDPKGGALQAYLKITGTKQGEKKGNP